MSRHPSAGQGLDSGDKFGDVTVPILQPSVAKQNLKEYLEAMATLHPDIEHPTMEFVDALCEDQVGVKDQDSTAMEVCTGESAMEQVQASIRSLELSVQTKFSQIQSQLTVQDTRNMLTEVSSRQHVLTQREKDRKFRSNCFTQPLAKFHALDLFDIQQAVADLTSQASLVCPTLASTFGTSAALGQPQPEFDPNQTVTLGEVAPVWELMSRLLWTVDNKVHIQQMAGTSKAGYVPTYNYIQRKQDGNASFSGSRTDREYWAAERLDLEKEILKERAHEKQLAGLSSASSKKSASKGSANSSESAESSGTPKTAKQKHNAKQRKLYAKRQKARKAKAKASAAAGADNSGGSKQ